MISSHLNLQSLQVGTPLHGGLPILWPAGAESSGALRTPDAQFIYAPTALTLARHWSPQSMGRHHVKSAPSQSMATASQPALALIKPRKVLLLRGCLVGAAPLLRLPAVFSGLTLCSHHTDFRRPKPCQGRLPFRRLWNAALPLGPYT